MVCACQVLHSVEPAGYDLFVMVAEPLLPSLRYAVITTLPLCVCKHAVVCGLCIMNNSVDFTAGMFTAVCACVWHAHVLLEQPLWPSAMHHSRLACLGFSPDRQLL